MELSTRNNPQLRHPMAIYEIVNHEEDRSSCCTLRCWLIVWGFLRLASCILWTQTLVVGERNWIDVQLYVIDSRGPITHWSIVTVAIVVQLVEFGMIVTFITAGFKKRASLYSVYYSYSILILIIHIIAVLLCFKLDFEYVHYLVEIYLTSYFSTFGSIFKNYYLIFSFLAIVNISLEILLICLIKKMIVKYSGLVR